MKSASDSFLKDIKRREALLNRLTGRVHDGLASVPAGLDVTKLAALAAGPDMSSLAARLGSQVDISHFVERVAGQADFAKLFSYLTQPTIVDACAGLITALREEHFSTVDVQPDGSLRIDGESASPNEIHEVFEEFADQPDHFLQKIRERLYNKAWRYIGTYWMEAITIVGFVLAIYAVWQAHKSDETRDAQFQESQRERREQAR